MEKLQTLLLIALGLGTFVWRMVKKAQETAAQEARERPRRASDSVPPLPNTSFQEMLKQMQAQNREATPEPARPPVGRLQPSVAAAQRGATTAAVLPAAPTLARSEGRPAARRSVADLLRSPADVRAAFVLSEIFKPKF